MITDKKSSFRLSILMYSAFIVALVSLVWGALVYSQIAGMSGEPAETYLHCLLLISDACNFYRGMGWMQGLNPYEPLVFWWALSLACLTFFFRKQCH